MKRFFSLVLCAIFILSFALIPAMALETEEKNFTTTSIEYLDDGSYLVIEVTQTPSVTRSTSQTTSGSKTATHYGADGTAIWKVIVNGTFTYTSGVSAKATSASATVGLIASNTTFVEKNAYTSGASAYGYGKVKYLGLPFSKTVVLTCDKYGKLS